MSCHDTGAITIPMPQLPSQSHFALKPSGYSFSFDSYAIKAHTRDVDRKRCPFRALGITLAADDGRAVG